MRPQAFVILFALVCIVAACSDDEDTTITGSGNLVSTSYDFEDFEGVNASTGFDVRISYADTFSVAVTADDNILSYLDVQQLGKAIFLTLKNGSDVEGATLKADVTMPRIQSYNGSTGSKGQIEAGFDSKSPFNCTLAIGSTLAGVVNAGYSSFYLSGGSTATGSYTVDMCDVIVTDGSKVTFSGSCSRLVLDASNGSNADLRAFQADSGSVRVTVGSTASVYVMHSISSVEVADGSSLYIRGTPVIKQQNVTGDSKVEFIGG